jgi:ketosteroid isomerase-like protein
MSDHLETLETIYRTLWRENRLDDALADLPADFEWLVPELPDGDRREGPEAVTDFLRDFIDQWDDLHVDWSLREADAQRVLAIVDMSGRGRASGVPANVRIGQIWTFRDGRPARMVAHMHVEDALVAAGIEP